jgi:hypothetical protein
MRRRIISTAVVALLLLVAIALPASATVERVTYADEVAEYDNTFNPYSWQWQCGGELGEDVHFHGTRSSSVVQTIFPTGDFIVRQDFSTEAIGYGSVTGEEYRLRYVLVEIDHYVVDPVTGELTWTVESESDHQLITKTGGGVVYQWFYTDHQGELSEAEHYTQTDHPCIPGNVHYKQAP